MTQRLHYFQTGTTFDPDDETAIDVARLAIAAEDLRAVMIGFAPDVEVRSEYFERKGIQMRQDFFRNLMFRWWLTALENVREPVENLRRHLPLKTQDFGDWCAQVERALSETLAMLDGTPVDGPNISFSKETRNQLGGHLDPRMVKQGLGRVDQAAPGSYVLGDRFAVEFRFVDAVLDAILGGHLTFEPKKAGDAKPWVASSEEWGRHVFGPTGCWNVLPKIQTVVGAFLRTRGIPA